MIKVDIHQAKKKLVHLLKRVEQGEEVIIMRDDKANCKNYRVSLRTKTAEAGFYERKNYDFARFR